jgi:hypothetical protein
MGMQAICLDNRSPGGDLDPPQFALGLYCFRPCLVKGGLMSVADQVLVKCSACGKSFSIAASATNRSARCPCGQVMLVPAKRAAGADWNAEDDPYELSEEPAPQPVAAKPANRPVSKDEVLSRLGHTYIAQKKLGPDEAEVLAAERRMEEMLDPSPILEVWIPLVLLAAGLVLNCVDIMWATHHPPRPPILGFFLATMRAALSTSLIVGGLFLSTVFLDVCIVGQFSRSILRICGIAIAPSALYGILGYAIGDVAGSATGVLVSIAVYAVLYHFLLNLDLKDTSICVLITWILITAVNYAAYKVQGAQTGSWI